ncbi:hypothetical protein EVG20_g4643 [Dentipellis fragilis]|uniref:Uncharacterized protein n=1 Tax=Dentipellis fragilis TaxID=205917 RepID=A0A4Y9YXG2_9AGAM|nr:hypothetical protein EVG20_g4643 [Dentipellis fragilis]
MWTTEDQLQYLESHLADYKKRQVEGTTADIWPKVFSGWFESWPEDNDKVRRRIKEWFNNRTRGSGGGHSRSRRVLKLGLRRRKLAAYQCYQKLYWKEKLEQQVKPAYKEYLKGLPAGTTAEGELAFRNRMCAELLEKESDEVKAFVEKARETSRLAVEGEGGSVVDMDNDGEDAVLDEEMRKLKIWDDNIEALPSTLRNLVKDIQELTGWTCNILFGGPNPRNKGKLESYAIDSETPGQASFKDMYPNYHQSLEKPFVEFLNKIYPPEVRAKRSLTLRKAGDGEDAKSTNLDDMTGDAGGDTEKNGRRQLEINNNNNNNNNEDENEDDDEGDDDDDDEDPIMATRRRNLAEQAEWRKKLGLDTSDRRREAPSQQAQDEIAAIAKSAGLTGVPKARPLTAKSTVSTKKRGTAALAEEEASRALHTAGHAETNTDASAKDTSTDDTVAETDAAEEETDTGHEDTTNTTTHVGMDNTTGRSANGAPIERTPGTTEVERAARSPATDSTRVLPAAAAVHSGEKDTDIPETAVNEPEWVKDARVFLKTGPRNVEWNGIVDKWGACENLLDYPSATSRKHWVGKAKRPFVVGQWMQEGKHYERVPGLGNLTGFGDAYRRWWTSFQPGWRSASEHAWPLKRDGDDKTFDDLAKGGSNGLFIFLIPLVWWSRQAKTKREKNELQSVVEDVDFVFTKVLGVLKARAALEGGEDEVENRNKESSSDREVGGERKGKEMGKELAGKKRRQELEPESSRVLRKRTRTS